MLKFVQLFATLMVAWALVGNMAEPTTIVTPGKRSVEIPEQTLTVDNELQTPIVFDGQQYTFPKGTSDEEVISFLSNMPAEEEAVEEAPSEPFREEEIIKKDEGVKRDKEGSHIAYVDTEKHLTGGRGHLLTKEEKKQYPKGTVIPDDVVKAWFKTDMDTANKDLTAILEDKAMHVPDEVFDILLNMSFNLGKKGLLTFKKMWAAVEVGDWATASREMEDSKWAKQVKNRAVRLADRMASIPSNVQEEEITATDNLVPSKGGLFKDSETGVLFMIDAEGNKTEV